MSGTGTLWEQRWHPLREEWVLVAAHRQHRPWAGAVVPAAPAARPTYDPACPLCPGNARSSGVSNPHYGGVFCFENDHPCAGPGAPVPVQPPPPYRVQRALGGARVLCFHPRHDVDLALLASAEIEDVVGAWRRETHDLMQRPGVVHVLAFENKGEVVGVSNPHPHGQIYATSFVWKTVETELTAMRRHAEETGRGLLADVLSAEAADGRRMLYQDEHTAAFVPYFARYAYETLVVPKRPVGRITDLRDAEVAALARALKDVLVRFDNLWRTPFPYVMALHQAPQGAERDFHCYLGLLPPLRRPDLQKFLAGPEIGGGNFLSDTSPEEKAAELRALDPLHWRAEAP